MNIKWIKRTQMKKRRMEDWEQLCSRSEMLSTVVRRTSAFNLIAVPLRRVPLGLRCEPGTYLAAVQQTGALTTKLRNTSSAECGPCALVTLQRKVNGQDKSNPWMENGRQVEVRLQDGIEEDGKKFYEMKPLFYILKGLSHDKDFKNFD